jgi:hypothetical protein
MMPSALNSLSSQAIKAGRKSISPWKSRVQCRAFTVTTFFRPRTFPPWRKKNFVRVLVQTGNSDRRLADVPTVQELLQEYKSPEMTRRVAMLALASGEFGRPIIATPGIPPDRIKVLRDAFAKTLKDSDLLAEAQKRRLEIDPTAGQDLEALASEVLSANQDVIDRLDKLLSK